MIYFPLAPWEIKFAGKYAILQRRRSDDAARHLTRDHRAIYEKRRGRFVSFYSLFKNEVRGDDFVWRRRGARNRLDYGNSRARLESLRDPRSFASSWTTRGRERLDLRYERNFCAIPRQSSGDIGRMPHRRSQHTCGFAPAFVEALDARWFILA